MKSAIIGSLLLALGSAQTDWTCNHYSSYPTGTCWSFSSSTQYLFKCNGTDTLMWYTYTDGSCGTDDASPWSVTSYSDSDTFQCDQSSSCGYANLRYYYDEECTGDSYFDAVVITECYDLGSTSSEVSCSGSSYTTTSYSAADDCTGDSTSVTVKYDSDYNDLITGCYEIICSGGGGGSGAAERTALTAFMAVAGAVLYRLF